MGPLTAPCCDPLSPPRLVPSPRGLEFTAAGGVNPKVGGTSLDGTLAGVRPVQPLA